MVNSLPRKLRDITDGLHCPYSCNMVHGHFKGVRDYSEPRFATVLTLKLRQPNTVVDVTGCAWITGFCLATATRDIDSVQSTLDDQGHAPRWTTLEILSKQGTYNKEADVFSFAAVMIEVRSGLPSVCRGLAYTST